MTELQQPLSLADIDMSYFDPIEVGSTDMLLRIDEVVANWGARAPFYIDVDGVPMVVVGRHQECKDVLLDSETFSCEIPAVVGYEKFDKFLGVHTLAQMDGENHHRIRRLIQPAFSPRAVQGLQSEVELVVDGLLDDIEETGSDFCDGVTQFGSLLLDGILLTSMLRLDSAQREIFHEMHRVVPLTSTIRPGEPFPEECVRAFAAARETISTLMAEREANPGDDLVSVLVMARDEGDRLSNDELFDVVFTICVAALSGTSRAMARTLYGLFKQEGLMKQLSTDTSLVPQAIAESQRMYRQGYFMFPRIATKDTVIGGTPIPQGMVVRVSLHAASYDPAEFSDPTTFDLERRPSDWMAFGLGHHNCVGIRLARLIMQTAIERFVLRFPDAHLADPDFRPEYSGAVGELRMDTLPLLLR